MSERLTNLLWHTVNHVPSFLAGGVLGALAVKARDDGTFAQPVTLADLLPHQQGKRDGRGHKYMNGWRPVERTIQYHLQSCARLGLVVMGPPTTGGPGLWRTIERLCPDRIVSLTVVEVAADAVFRKTHRKSGTGATVAATGATVAPVQTPGTEPADRDFHRGTSATAGATEAENECNSGCNRPSVLISNTYERSNRASAGADPPPVENADPTQLTFGPSGATTAGPEPTGTLADHHWTRFADALRDGLAKGRKTA